MNLYRSLFIKDLPDESFLKILERLAEKGYLQNNQQLKHRGYREFACGLLNISPFLEVFCSMKNLAIMCLDYELTLKDLAHVFQTCPKLIELNTVTKECKTLEMAEQLNIQLRSGFQRLRRLGLLCFINNDSWPVLQEMLT
jgi:hypothetical protein